MRQRRVHGINTRGFAAVSVSVGLFAGLVGCSGGGDERSAEAFCSTMKSEKQRILAQFEATSSAGSPESLEGALAGAGASIQALGELRTYLHRLSDVAPDEIQAPLEIVKDAYDKQFEQMGDAARNPLGALASGLVGSMATSGQLSELDAYAREHCGEGI